MRARAARLASLTGADLGWAAFGGECTPRIGQEVTYHVCKNLLLLVCERIWKRPEPRPPAPRGTPFVPLAPLVPFVHQARAPEAETAQGGVERGAALIPAADGWEKAWAVPEAWAQWRFASAGSTFRASLAFDLANLTTPVPSVWMPFASGRDLTGGFSRGAVYPFQTRVLTGSFENWPDLELAGNLPYPAHHVTPSRANTGFARTTPGTFTVSFFGRSDDGSGGAVLDHETIAGETMTAGTTTVPFGRFRPNGSLETEGQLPALTYTWTPAYTSGPGLVLWLLPVFWEVEGGQLLVHIYTPQPGVFGPFFKKVVQDGYQQDQGAFSSSFAPYGWAIATIGTVMINVARPDVSVANVPDTGACIWVDQPALHPYLWDSSGTDARSNRDIFREKAYRDAVPANVAVGQVAYSKSFVDPEDATRTYGVTFINVGSSMATLPHSTTSPPTATTSALNASTDTSAAYNAAVGWLHDTSDGTIPVPFSNHADGSWRGLTVPGSSEFHLTELIAGGRLIAVLARGTTAASVVDVSIDGTLAWSGVISDLVGDGVTLIRDTTFQPFPLARLLHPNYPEAFAELEGFLLRARDRSDRAGRSWASTAASPPPVIIVATADR